MTLSTAQPAILMCQLLEKQELVYSDEVIVTRTLLSCLSEATGRISGLIVVSFANRPISVRSGIIELCACLKNNPLTRKTPLAALMGAPHRDMALKMRSAGVRFMKIHPPEIPVDPACIANAIQSGDALFRIDRILEGLCPFLNYAPIDDHCELISCRAYRNKMVLGGKRLHEICETEGHLHCEYFLNPRNRS